MTRPVSLAALTVLDVEILRLKPSYIPPEGELAINAARGVVLAAGGFPNDVERRRELCPKTPTGREH